MESTYRRAHVCCGEDGVGCVGTRAGPRSCPWGSVKPRAMAGVLAAADDYLVAAGDAQ